MLSAFLLSKGKKFKADLFLWKHEVERSPAFWQLKDKYWLSKSRKIECTFQLSSFISSWHWRRRTRWKVESAFQLSSFKPNLGEDKLNEEWKVGKQKDGKHSPKSVLIIKLYTIRTLLGLCFPTFCFPTFYWTAWKQRQVSTFMHEKRESRKLESTALKVCL